MCAPTYADFDLLIDIGTEGYRAGCSIPRPALVRGALFDAAILLGFRLDSWAFRGLCYGLIRQTGQERDRRGICVVRLPPEERARQEKYPHGYIDREARLDIFWGSLEEYTLVDNIFICNLLPSIDQGTNPARLVPVALADFLARLTRQSLPDARGREHKGWVYDAGATPAPAAASSRRYALIVDQFEEIITSHPGRRRG